MEPQLCGACENYLNLGCFYDADGLGEKRPALLALREANLAVYPAVYAELSAARDLERCARASVRSIDPEGLFQLTRHFFDLPPARASEGSSRDVFLRAWTPEGLTDHTTSAAALCRTCVELRDPCGLSAPLLERLSRHCLRGGCDCIRVLSPVDPTRLEGLLVPALNLALLTNAGPGVKCAVTVDVEPFFPPSDQTRDLLEHAAMHCAAASALMSEAKRIHDELEALCRPYVSFEGLDLLTQEYRKQLRAELLKK